MDEIRQIKDRLKEAMSYRGIQPKELSDKTGIPLSSISQYMSGFTKPKSDRIYLLAQALDVQKAWLMGFDVEMERKKSTSIVHRNFDNIYPIDLHRYPVAGEIACGEPIYADEDRESYVMSGTAIHADFCLRAKGDSMKDARIYDGDIVFIRKDEELINGEIYAIAIGDEATLKRVYLDEEKNVLTLNPANKDYAPLTYIGDELNDIHILGKAVAFQSDVR